MLILISSYQNVVHFLSLYSLKKVWDLLSAGSYLFMLLQDLLQWCQIFFLEIIFKENLEKPGNGFLSTKSTFLGEKICLTIEAIFHASFLLSSPFGIILLFSSVNTPSLSISLKKQIVTWFKKDNSLVTSFLLVLLPHHMCFNVIFLVWEIMLNSLLLTLYFLSWSQVLLF